MRKIKLFIATSLDGYIAGPDDDLSFLSRYEGEDFGHAEFSASVDTYLVGRRTYDVVMKIAGNFPAAEQYKYCYVVTRRDMPDQPGITFHKGDVVELARQLKTQPGKDIYCDGGAQVIKALMQERLVDTFTLFVMPIFLGEGIRLFPGGIPETEVTLQSVQSYGNGAVRLQYQLKTND
ncbi:MAG: dihydrofolate reductase family protein [Phaeodactylibacter sp.]|uniref:dihydrofolate reductase family protein n=1 Tax=Phaeodactylibacter sp. TaxID=1940289 RepID=UPI0032EFA62A